MQDLENLTIWNFIYFCTAESALKKRILLILTIIILSSEWGSGSRGELSACPMSMQISSTYYYWMLSVVWCKCTVCPPLPPPPNILYSYSLISACRDRRVRVDRPTATAVRPIPDINNGSPETRAIRLSAAAAIIRRRIRAIFGRISRHRSVS